MTALEGVPSPPPQIQRLLSSVEQANAEQVSSSVAALDTSQGTPSVDSRSANSFPSSVQPEDITDSPNPSASTIQSDLSLDQAKLLQSAITPETRMFNQRLQELEAQGPKWYEIGPEKYRQLRKDGRTPLPGVVLVPTARPFSIPSRDPNRSIPCRLLTPQATHGTDAHPSRGILLHLHGGGWVLNDETSSDVYLQSMADSCGLTCLSVGYFLAPENPYPAAPNDCEDVALWLITNGVQTFGSPLSFIGGESAGATLAVVVALRLLQNPQISDFQLKGLLLHYGPYSLRWHPGLMQFRKDPTLVLDEVSMGHFREAYCQGMTPEQLISPDVSPFFADLRGIRLPPALFTAGTEDCLLEDTVFMCVRWMMAGHEAILKLYPGSPHGFILFKPDQHDNTRMALLDVQSFIEMNSC